MLQFHMECILLTWLHIIYTSICHKPDHSMLRCE